MITCEDFSGGGGLYICLRYDISGSQVGDNGCLLQEILATIAHDCRKKKTLDQGNNDDRSQVNGH